MLIVPIMVYLFFLLFDVMLNRKVILSFYLVRLINCQRTCANLARNFKIVELIPGTLPIEIGRISRMTNGDKTARSNQSECL